MGRKRISLNEVWQRRLTVMLATGFYTGYAPVAPGTFGTLVGVLLVLIFGESPLFFQISFTLFLCGAAVWASEKAQIIFKRKDASYIVIDEIVGMMVTMIGMPVTGYWLVCGFLVFRVLDIAKLPPANYFDSKLKNGWGVVMDDVVSGIYGNLLLHLMLRTTI